MLEEWAQTIDKKLMTAIDTGDAKTVSEMIKSGVPYDLDHVWAAAASNAPQVIKVFLDDGYFPNYEFWNFCDIQSRNESKLLKKVPVSKEDSLVNRAMQIGAQVTRFWELDGWGPVLLEIRQKVGIEDPKNLEDMIEFHEFELERLKRKR